MLGEVVLRHWLPQKWFGLWDYLLSEAF
jgi:hypothetical protein